METVTCSACESPFSINRAALRQAGMFAMCPICMVPLHLPEKEKKGRSDDQLRSKDQEKKAARRYGGRRQPGSGASKRAKGDFRDAGRTRGECKFTRAASFSLKLEELMKLEKEASAAETPLFEVQFQGVHPAKTYVVLPADTYQTLMDKLEALQG